MNDNPTTMLDELLLLTKQVAVQVLAALLIALILKRAR
jgi:hypothetical protein